MLFVVEGPDRTGKSSLCERLAGEHGGRVLHFSKPESDAIVEYVRPLQAYLPGAGESFFVDRHYLGELVWPDFFGRESRMTKLEQHCIELFLLSRGALCVLAWREPGSLARACRDEPIAGRTGEATRAFTRAARGSLLPWWRYKHGDDVDSLVSRALDLEREAAQRWIHVWDEKDAAVNAVLAR